MDELPSAERVSEPPDRHQEADAGKVGWTGGEQRWEHPGGAQR